MKQLKQHWYKTWSTIRSLFNLIRTGNLGWFVYVMENKLCYHLNALQAGVHMNQKGEGSLYNLRRNIHRIEKGLSYHPPKPIFAENFISETVQYMSSLQQLPDGDQATLWWGAAVLEQYFKVCQHTPQIEAAYQLYCTLGIKNPQMSWIPYSEDLRVKSNIDYDSLMQLVQRRKSVRYYLDKPVEFDVIRKAMDIARYAPSACNRQAYEFLFYNNRDVVDKIASIPGGVDGYSLPSIVVVIGKYRAYFDERDVNVPVIDSSLAVMIFLFALETLGLSSVCINWPGLPDRDRRIRQLIHLDDDEFVVMLIGIGYPDPAGKILYSAKREIDDLLSCNARLDRE